MNDGRDRSTSVILILQSQEKDLSKIIASYGHLCNYAPIVRLLSHDCGIGMTASLRFAPVLNQLDLVAFWRVDEANFTNASRMRPVRQRITFCRRLFGELFQIVHFESEMCKIGANHDR